MGLVRFRNWRVEKEWSSLINPQAPVSPMARRVHGISIKLLAKAATAKAVLPEFLDHIRGACVIVHNAGYDVPILARDLTRCQREVPRLLDRANVIDTCALARALCREAGSAQLGRLAEHFGIEVPAQHRALADARTAMKVFEALCSRAADGIGARLAPALAALKSEIPATPATRASGPSGAGWYDRIGGMLSMVVHHSGGAARRRAILVGRAKELVFLGSVASFHEGFALASREAPAAKTRRCRGPLDTVPDARPDAPKSPRTTLPG